jgi:hypothetical protein
MLLEALLDFFTSLRLTVVCLCFALVLVFVGTLAQVDLGLYKAQNEFFRSFFVYWGPAGASWKIPVMPGGYLVGSVLLINLIAAHIKRFTLTWKKSGIFMVHAGLILLLLGQLLTDASSSESAMHLRVGDTLNYSEEDRRAELAVVDVSDPDSDKVVAIPDSLMAPGHVVGNPGMPFSIMVGKYYPNSSVSESQKETFEASPATEGAGVGLWLRGEPKVTSTDYRDVPSAVIELVTLQGSLGKWLVSEFLGPQTVTVGNRTYQITLRPRRHYNPFTLKLLKFNHAIYKGTDIPKDFSSVVRLERPDTGEAREVRIFMNNPLRYNGETFYQQSFDQDDKGSVLEVVHNPSRLTPYISCVLVGLGLVVQFGMHLFSFARKRRLAVA